MNINLRATFILVKGVVEHMKAQRWGRIIFMSSIAAQGGGINGCRKPIHCPWCVSLLFCSFKAVSDYVASKGGLTGMMKNLSTRLAEYNISVNDVAPAMIGDTGMLSSAAVFPEEAASIPLKRLGIPAEKQRMLLPCWWRLGTWRAKVSFWLEGWNRFWYIECYLHIFQSVLFLSTLWLSHRCSFLHLWVAKLFRWNKQKS
jgi:NAD(P)-dependent dehydrogenase (short-subunit alcohol dehydrogenase family)